MEHTPEDLEHFSTLQQAEESQGYTLRPRSHIILALVTVLVVLLECLGTCYWLAFYR